MSSAEQAAALLERLRAGEGEALGELFELHRERLWRMIAVRLDRRLGRRVWADDVLQEAFIDMAGKGPERNRAVDLLRQLVADFPAVPDYRMDLCETLGRPGPPGRPKEDRLEEAIQLSGKLRAEYPNVPEHTAAQARYLDLLGIVRYEARQLDEAEKLHSRAVDLQARLVQQYPQVTAYRCWLSLMERSLGRVLSDKGNLAEPRRRLEAAVDRLAPLQNDPRLGGLRPFLETAYRDLARVHDRSGNTALAAAALQKANALAPRGRPGPFPPGRKEGRR